jgi:hypothetical protein
MCPSMLEHITSQTFHKICVINIEVQYYLYYQTCQLSVHHSLFHYFLMLDYLDYVNLANPPTKHQCFA